MSQCLHCSATAIYNFHVLEVQTLHIRDISGERRVQALGLFQNYAICRNCAETQLQLTTQFNWTIIKKIFPFLIIFLLGIIVLYYNKQNNLVFFLFSFSAFFCGIVGFYSHLKKFFSNKKYYTSLEKEEALLKAAWDCVLMYAPKKDGDNDLTYIPINETTINFDVKSLMQSYDLLPAIAQKTWELLHSKK